MFFSQIGGGGGSTLSPYLGKSTHVAFEIPVPPWLVTILNRQLHRYWKLLFSQSISISQLQNNCKVQLGISVDTSVNPFFCFLECSISCDPFCNIFLWCFPVGRCSYQTRWVLSSFNLSRKKFNALVSS